MSRVCTRSLRACTVARINRISQQSWSYAETNYGAIGKSDFHITSRGPATRRNSKEQFLSSAVIGTPFFDRVFVHCYGHWP